MKKKTALVTGASSGIGTEIARELDRRGFRVILSARRADRLEKLAEELNDAVAIPADLSVREECFGLYRKAKAYFPVVVVNCAGFGTFGEFTDTELTKELSMIDVNITAVHILTKLFLKDFKEKDKGFILNVASSAGLMPAGPYMAGYYASKAYVTSLTTAVSEELRSAGSHVYIGALCPGPVDTEFNDVAGVNFGLKGITAKECAEYGVREMFARKTIIVPTVTMKAAGIAQKFVPRKLAAAVAGELQKKKN